MERTALYSWPQPGRLVVSRPGRGSLVLVVLVLRLGHLTLALTDTTAEALAPDEVYVAR